MSHINFSGVFTALATPFRNGAVAYDGLRRLIQTQIESGINGLVPTGTTGESPALDMDEHIEVIRCAVEAAAGRAPVIAGAGANSTKEAAELTRQAHQAGADGFLHVTPYYNKPTQEGLFRHFSAVAEETDRPVVLYSIPSRCVIEIETDTLVRLARRYPHVCALKEAGGSCDRVSRVIQALGDDITVLSGDDSLTLPFMAVGAKGVISVASNLIPAEMVEMTRAALENDFSTALALHRRLFPLFKDLFIETNPIPVKHALARAGLIASAELRPPLCELGEENRLVLDKTLSQLNIQPCR